MMDCRFFWYDIALIQNLRCSERGFTRHRQECKVNQVPVTDGNSVFRIGAWVFIFCIFFMISDGMRGFERETGVVPIRESPSAPPPGGPGRRLQRPRVPGAHGRRVPAQGDGVPDGGAGAVEAGRLRRARAPLAITSVSKSPASKPWGRTLIENRFVSHVHSMRNTVGGGVWDNQLLNNPRIPRRSKQPMAHKAISLWHRASEAGFEVS